MIQMKEKTKKIVMGIIGGILLLSGILGYFIFLNKNTKEEKVLKKETYTTYVKINPLVKLTFDVSYYECVNGNKEVDDCGDIKTEVVDTNLLNEEAKDAYKDTDLKGKSLEDAITLLINTTLAKNYEIEKVNVITNWNYDYEEIKSIIMDKINSKITIDINYQEVLDEAAIIKEDKNTTVDITSDNSKKDDSQNMQKPIKCTPKKFAKKYSYVYESKDICMSNGNKDFNTVSDNIDNEIFAYDCLEIVDDCGTKWYGVVFYKYSLERGEYPVYY